MADRRRNPWSVLGATLQDVAASLGGTRGGYLTEYARGLREEEESEKVAKLAMDKYLMGQGYYTKPLAKEDVLSDIATRGSFMPGDYANIGGAFYKKKPLTAEETLNLRLKEQRATAGVLKPGQQRTTMDIQLTKMAQSEALRRLGGAAMVGLRPEKQKEYERLTKEIYRQYQTQFGGRGMSLRETLVDDEEMMDFGF